MEKQRTLTSFYKVVRPGNEYPDLIVIKKVDGKTLRDLDAGDPGYPLEYHLYEVLPVSGFEIFLICASMSGDPRGNFDDEVAYHRWHMMVSPDGQKYFFYSEYSYTGRIGGRSTYQLIQEPPRAILDKIK